MRKFGAVLAMSVLLATAGCGGGSSSRPSADEISKALRNGKDSVLGSASSTLSKKAADCVGKAFVDSKLSDQSLQAIVKGDKAYKPSATDKSAITGLESKIVKCISPALAP